MSLAYFPAYYTFSTKIPREVENTDDECLGNWIKLLMGMYEKEGSPRSYVSVDIIELKILILEG